MRKIALALSTAALAWSGTAFAQAATPAAPARAAKPDMTRADAQARAEAMFARLDANRDGTLNEADRAAMKTQMFDRLDTDRNGAISQAELAARGGNRDGGKMGQRRMAKREGAPAMTEAQKTERRAQMFARIDTDRNGSLSREEFDAMHAARGDRAKAAPRTADGAAAGQRKGRGMMKMDGPVTRQAFIDGALARFDRSDANRDGTVTQAERKAARDAIREQWRAQRQQG